MEDKNAVASLHSLKVKRNKLWQQAIKWPLYSVAVMPILLATGLKIGLGHEIRFNQLLGFLIASVLLLIWENLTNDLFDDETGVDKFKLHSVVNLTGSRKVIRILAYTTLFLGLLLMLKLSFTSNSSVFFLVIGACVLGYLYQGPPFRLGYQGLGEPLCWIAFGPLATAAALLVLSPESSQNNSIPWETALKLGSGPAIATTLVLFCASFHQVVEDKEYGKKTLLVRLGTHRAASLIPWFIAFTLGLEWIPIMNGSWPITVLLSGISIPPAILLIKLLKRHHNNPEAISDSKFIALKFQTLNGLGLSIGLAIAPFLGISFSNRI